MQPVSNTARHTEQLHRQDILVFQDHRTRCLEWSCGRHDHDMSVHRDVSFDGTSDSSGQDENLPHLHSRWSSTCTWQCYLWTDSSTTATLDSFSYTGLDSSASTTSNLPGAAAPALKFRADVAIMWPWIHKEPILVFLILSRLFLKEFTVLESIAS